MEKPEDSFSLTVRKVPDDLKTSTVIMPNKGSLIAKQDLLPKDGFLLEPNSEFEDTAAIVLPTGSTVSLYAEIQHDDYNYAGQIVRVVP